MYKKEFWRALSEKITGTFGRETQICLMRLRGILSRQFARINIVSSEACYQFVYNYSVFLPVKNIYHQIEIPRERNPQKVRQLYISRPRCNLYKLFYHIQNQQP